MALSTWTKRVKIPCKIKMLYFFVIVSPRPLIWHTTQFYFLCSKKWLMYSLIKILYWEWVWIWLSVVCQMKALDDMITIKYNILISYWLLVHFFLVESTKIALLNRKKGGQILFFFKSTIIIFDSLIKTFNLAYHT